MHEHQPCPRCKKHFECKVGNIAQCHCSAVLLTQEERVYIENRYMDCLCGPCLQALRFEHKLNKYHIDRGMNKS